MHLYILERLKSYIDNDIFLTEIVIRKFRINTPPHLPTPPPANSVANLIQINGFLRHSKSMHFESYLRQEVKFT